MVNDDIINDINAKVSKEIRDFCKTIFEKYPAVTGLNIYGNKPNLSISLRLTFVR